METEQPTVDPPSPRRSRGGGAISLLRLWLWGSAAVIAFLVIWAIAPVLFLLFALIAAIGIVCAGTIKLARMLEAWKSSGDRGPT